MIKQTLITLSLLVAVSAVMTPVVAVADGSVSKHFVDDQSTSNGDATSGGDNSASDTNNDDTITDEGDQSSSSDAE